MPFFHGIQVNELTEGARPILEQSTAVIGLVATASAEAGAATAALNAAFPLDRPVLVRDVRSAAARAGTGGTLAKALTAIAAQGSPTVIVVRVAVAEDGEDQDELTIGGSTDGDYTGVEALLAAESRLGIRPRILGAPGLDSQAVTDALVTVAQRLRGFVYAAATGISFGAAITYRENFGARELMLIWPDLTGWGGQAVATALGLRAMIDEREGWHKSLSNVAFLGATGISRDVTFDIRDASNSAGLLNAAQVTTIVRMNGFRFWGNRTTSDEPLFAFETATRTSQAIGDVVADGLAWAIDKPLTTGLVRDIVETGNGKLRQWVQQGRLIGAEMWFDPEANPSGELAAGRLVIDYAFTPCAPVEGLQLNQRITDRFYADFGAQLVA